jgi:hypothetical protein
MEAVLWPGRVLADPVDAVPAAVEARRWFWPLALVVLAASLSAAAFAVRWDPEAEVVGQLMESGELVRTTEQELSDKIRTAGRVALVAGVAKAVFGLPLMVVALATLLKLATWLFERRLLFSRAITLVSVALLPLALFHLLQAGAGFLQQIVTRDSFQALVPSSLAAVFPDAGRAGPWLAAVELFRLWGVVLAGLGLAAATGWPRWRGLALTFVLYAMLTALTLVGAGR